MPNSAGSMSRKTTIPDAKERPRSVSCVPKLHRSPERTASPNPSSPLAASPGPSDGTARSSVTRWTPRCKARGYEVAASAAFPDVESEGMVTVSAELPQHGVSSDPGVHLVTGLEDVGAQVMAVNSDDVTAGHQRRGHLVGQFVEPLRGEVHAHVAQDDEVEGVLIGKVVGHCVTLDGHAGPPLPP